MINLLGTKLAEERFDFVAVAKVQTMQLDAVSQVLRFSAPAAFTSDSRNLNVGFLQERLRQKSAGKPAYACDQNTHGLCSSSNVPPAFTQQAGRLCYA